MIFTKYHGAGNDFIVVDARELDLPWPDIARAMCARHFGVGSDGLILVADGDGGVRMRMFNPDGSEAEACGNGLRCFVKHVVDNGLVTDDTFTVDTLAGARRVAAFRASDGSVKDARLSMGPPRFAAEEIPANVPGHAAPLMDIALQVPGRGLTVSLVSMGNPHAVAFLDEPPAGFPLCTVGPLVEKHEMFPSRVNFEIAQVRNAAEIDARVWERGTGETLACGTGACAIAVAAIVKGLCNNAVTVHLPGGDLIIEWPGGEQEVALQGPVERVFTGEWPEPRT